MSTHEEARKKHLDEVKKNADDLNIVSTEVASLAIRDRLGSSYIYGFTDIRYCKQLGHLCISNDFSNYKYVIGLSDKPPLVEINLSPSKIVIVKFLHLFPESDSMSDITICVECQHLKKKMEELFILTPVCDYVTNPAFTLEFKEKSK